MLQYRTEEYRIYPDKQQAYAICMKLDAADTAFDELAAFVNRLSAQTKDAAVVNAAIERFAPTVWMDNVELQSVKRQVYKLSQKLLSGAIQIILPRNRNRSVRILDVCVLRTPVEQVMINGVGPVRLVLHRVLPNNAHVFRVSLKSDCCGERLFLQYSYYFESADVVLRPVNPAQVLGIDYKQDGLYVDSNGNSAEYPGFRQQGREKLIRYKSNTIRFKKGSRRWQKHQSRLVKYERHIQHQRADWQSKKAEELAANWDAVCQETLDFRAMIQGDPRLATKIYDNDMPSFSRRLTKKLEQQGKRLIHVSKYYASSQICSYCGSFFGPRPLGEKVFTCPFCGLVIDRDVNAARNIKKEGLRLMQTA